jgi:hypothetical protein
MFVIPIGDEERVPAKVYPGGFLPGRASSRNLTELLNMTWIPARNHQRTGFRGNDNHFS